MAETVASAKGRLDGVEFGGHRIRLALVIGGFLDGTALELAWGPNWIIEARGTGKTTVLELVRFALVGGDYSIEKAKRILGYQPKHSAGEAIFSAYRWLYPG